MKNVNGKKEGNLPFLLCLGHAIPKNSKKPGVAAPGENMTPKNHEGVIMQAQTIKQAPATQDDHLPVTREIISAALHVGDMAAQTGKLGEDLAAVKRCLFAAADMARELESRAMARDKPEYRLFETTYAVQIFPFLPYPPNWGEMEEVTLTLRFPVRGADAKRPLVYLAAPYTHDLSRVMAQREQQATACAAWLMRQGVAVFSPLSHGHPIGGKLGPTTYDDWALVDERVLAVSDAVLVLDIPGAAESRGVRRELELARRLGIPASCILKYPPDAYLASSLPATFGWDGIPEEARA